MDPLPVVKTLQSMVLSDSGKLGKKNELSIDELLGKMTIKLNFFKRF